jgi:hypothetical protein
MSIDFQERCLTHNAPCKVTYIHDKAFVRRMSHPTEEPFEVEIIQKHSRCTAKVDKCSNITNITDTSIFHTLTRTLQVGLPRRQNPAKLEQDPVQLAVSKRPPQDTHANQREQASQREQEILTNQAFRHFFDLYIIGL